MAENNQLSDETKINSTNTSSTDDSSAVIGNHENAVVPHKISNHDKLVQTMVMVDGEWINVNDTNDQANVKYDMHKVNKKVVEAQKGIVEAKNAAESAVKYADSAVSASKVNSDAIAAQSSAIIEAKSAMDSATAEIQQLKANAASDVAQIRADVAQVQNEVDTAKAANSASVDKLKSDIGLAQKDLDNIHDSLTKAQSAVEQNQKLINDSVTKITSDVSATKQDLANVHDSLTKAQAAAEENQKVIDKSIAQINTNVDATNQDLAGVRKDLTKAQSDITANQKVVNDNVAQINSNIEQDRKDIASAQQANANTAKQLDTYSKQAQEQERTIKAVQDKQDGFSIALADVQGNVAQVSDKVDGLSANLKDAQGNVASVKAQADQLSATLTDHGKAIATLTASAKELSSTLEDADGRLSKVEQTAQTNSSTLSDVQGDLSQVKQNATKLVSTLKDAQGNISTLQQKADSVSTQLASAQGDIATLQTGVDSVKATLTSHDKSIHTLQADSKSLKDSMADAQGDISTLSKTATSLDSEMKDHAGRLSKVEQSAATQATTLSDLQGNLSQVKQQADGLVTTLKNAQGSITQIQQKADGTLAQLKSVQGDIASLQTDVTGIKATLVSHEGDIHTLQLDSKTLKDNMADAKGNISSLQKSSTKLDSEMSSQDGRLSKIEQTAKEHTSTISDLGKKVDSNGGGVNLAKQSSFHDIRLAELGAVWNIAQYGVSIDTGTVKSGALSLDARGLQHFSEIQQLIYVDPDTDYTFSMHLIWGKADKSFHAHVFMVENGSDGNPTSPYVDHSRDVANSAIRSANTYTIHTSKNTHSVRLYIRAESGSMIELEEVKLERGSVATPWTPAPEDLATVTQVKQTAGGIETALKNTQGDIDQIKQTAKGTSEQLSNVRGNVTTIQKDVDGLKQTTADNVGNIHTLQADSKTLKDDMADAKGNISSLQKTSTSLVSEFRDHDGRLNKVEQTATEHTSELADTKGNLDKVTQKANTLQLLLSDAQKNIQNIQLDAKGLHDTITGQSNQLANLNVTLNNLDSKYSGITGELQSKQTALSTEQQQTKDMLLRKADKSEVDNVKGTVNQVSAEQKTMADQINQKVSSVEYQTLKDKVNGMKIGTRNLLHHSDTFDGWHKGASVSVSSNKYLNGNIAVLKNTGSGGTALDADLDGPYDNQPISWAVYAKADNAGDKLHTELWGGGGTTDQALTTEWQSYKFTGQRDARGHSLYFWGCVGNKGNIYVALPFAVVGNYIGTWLANPDDTIAAISKNTTAIDENSKAIKLKADATEVNNLKGTVNSHSASINLFSDQLKSMVTESKVNDIINGKGFATQSTVQSLIDQKAGTLNESITKLSNDTVTHFQSITASLDGLQTNVTNYQNDTTSKYTQLSNLMQSKVGTADFEQLKRSVDMQILDYANIDNMKTTGHYFVHNLTGNPLGGWVYVDVTGNGNDRIRQDVYQDSGTKHAFRRWFGSYWTEWSTGAEESEITQLRSDINLRVKSGDLLSQINIAAGRTLIQSNKIYFDADSFVMSPNSTAFIPSAYITNINADKITTGTLDAAKFNVKNFSADNIVGGTLSGVVVKTGDNDRYFQTSKDNIYWVRNDGMSLVGNDTYLNRANGLNIADMNNIQLTTWGGASVNPDGSIVNTSGDAGHPKIVVDTNGNWDPDDPYGTKWGGGPGNSEIVQWIGNKEYTALTRGKGLTVRLNDENKNSVFVIQKDNKVGFYVGGGDDGGEIRIAGGGPIKLQGKYLDDGFNDGMTHTLGNLQVNNLRVRKWLGVDQSKNAIVKTSQGPVTINAYETAEYYFGDIGEGQTSADGIAYIGIEKLFNETVNTTIPYHVFITAYGPGNIWVDQREHNRFIVKSDQPNLKFSWEIKAKRKGYEQTRLQNVNDKLNHMAATS